MKLNEDIFRMKQLMRLVESEEEAKFTYLDLNTTEGYETYKNICQTFIDHRNPSAFVTGQMMADCAKKYSSQGYVPPELALAQITQEGGLRSELDIKPIRTKNPFNVGNTGSGKLNPRPSFEDGVCIYYDLMTRRYLKTSTPEDLLINFVNDEGSQYDRRGYEQEIEAMVKNVRRVTKNVPRDGGLLSVVERPKVDFDKVDFEINYDYNPEVVELQKYLVSLGYYIGKFGPMKDGIDGKYGPFTKAAHEAYKEGLTPEEFDNRRIQMAQEYIGDIEPNTLEGEFNFHEIPDGKNNYRSGQIPIEINGKQFLGEIIDKYGIKTIIRFNGDGDDSRRTSAHPSTSIAEEKKLAENKGVDFYTLSSRDDQEKVNELLDQGNVLIHCRHGQDRTGGNVGGYLYSKGWGNTKQIWDYTTKLNGWNRMVLNSPESFDKGGFLHQAKKFGVKDLEHAKKLAKGLE